MAGSLKYFVYTTDTNNDFGILQDEDWGELMSNPDVATNPAGVYGLPRNLEPRYATYRSVSGKRSVRIVISDPAVSTDDLPSTLVVTPARGESSDDADDNAMYLSALKGEQYTPIIAIDTGIQDGDAT